MLVSTFPENGPEGCLHADEQVFKTFYPHKAQGYDRYGRLLCFEHNGALNIPALRHHVTKERLIAYHLYTMERAFDEHFKRSPRDPSGMTPVSTFVICDFEGLNFSAVLLA